MFEHALNQRQLSLSKKITLKSLLSAGLVVLAVILPQIVHLALGQPGGVRLLPMYLPVLLGGCLLGVRWGLLVGLLSPLASFALTSALGNPMPAAARLPFMMLELAVFAVVSGLFTGKIAKNGLWAFAAVIAAQLSGRLVFLGAVALCQSFAPFTVPMIWGQIVSGWQGIAGQAVLVPLMVIGIRRLMLGADE